jgi:protein O-mannosyl-transferase
MPPSPAGRSAGCAGRSGSSLGLGGWAQAWLVLAVLAAYANSLAGAFQFDDYNVIVDAASVHSFSAWWQGMPGIRPLLKLSYAANWALDERAVGFHAVNVAVHAANTLLVFHLLRRLAPRLGIDAELAPSVALIAALIFALHPAQTEAVTYISGRSVSLMALWALASLWAWLEADDGRRPAAWRLACAAAFAAALAVKENAWALPLALLLCAASSRDFGWRAFLARTAWPWAVLLGFAAAVGLLPAYGRLLDASLQIRPLAENLLTQVNGVFYLITRPLLGLAVNIDPDLPVYKAFTPELGAKAALLAAWLAAALWHWRRSRGSRWFGFGTVWFAVWLMPTNSFLPRFDVANDRQLYLALLGPALIVAVLLGRWHAGGARSALAAKAVTALLLLVLSFATVMRNRDYRSEVALWEHTSQASPNKPRVWNNLGYARQQAGDVQGAKQAYREALRLDPTQWRARNNLDLLQ